MPKGRSAIWHPPTRQRMYQARKHLPRSENPVPKEPYVYKHERITVCIITREGSCDMVSDVRDNLAAVSRLINNGRMVPRRYLHVMPVKVGTESPRTYGVLYGMKKEVDALDETVVFRSQDVNGKNIYTGLPLGTVAVFTFDNRRAGEPTRPGTLSDEDREFLTSHIFSKDGHVFLMAEADKRY